MCIHDAERCYKHLEWVQVETATAGKYAGRIGDSVHSKLRRQVLKKTLKLKDIFSDGRFDGRITDDDRAFLDELYGGGESDG